MAIFLYLSIGGTFFGDDMSLTIVYFKRLGSRHIHKEIDIS